MLLGWSPGTPRPSTPAWTRATLDHLATPRLLVAHNSLSLPMHQCVLVSLLGLPMVQTEASLGAQMLSQRCMGVTRPVGKGAHVDVVQECHESFFLPQLSITATRALNCPDVHVLTHLIFPQLFSMWQKIAAREMNAPTPSTDKMVDRGSNSERANTTCATHSVPARV